MGMKDLLVTYIDRIGETDAVDAIAEVDGVEAAVRATATIVRDAAEGVGAPNDLSAALTWVRDGSIGVGSEAVKTAVRACVPRYLKPALIDALIAPVYMVRHQAIYTLGKMAFREDLPLLLNVFERYLDHDPLLVPKLIGEISWLGGEGAPLLARVLTHPHYLTRWSFFGTDAARPSRAQEMEALKATCAELGADQAGVVRAEARHVLAEIEMVEEFAKNGLQHDRASRRERKRRRAEHEATAPLRFDVMGLRFLNAHDGADYDVDALDAFVRSLTGPSGGA
jgi:hypothetical protein